jgi:hypothetical protein
LGEEVSYSGFPLYVGVDSKFKQNIPVEVRGYISRVAPSESEFILQIPTFRGASGSPIFSRKTGRFVGVIRAIVGSKNLAPSQESFGVGVRGDSVIQWLIRTIPFKKVHGRKKNNNQ